MGTPTLALAAPAFARAAAPKAQAFSNTEAIAIEAGGDGFRVDTRRT
jgi:hypothetical protein